MTSRALLISLLVATPLVAEAQETGPLREEVRVALLSELDRELVRLETFDTTPSYRGVSVLFASSAVLGIAAGIASQEGPEPCTGWICVDPFGADFHVAAVTSLVVLGALPAVFGLVWLIVTLADDAGRSSSARELRRRRERLVDQGALALEPTRLGLRF